MTGAVWTVTLGATLLLVAPATEASAYSFYVTEYSWAADVTIHVTEFATSADCIMSPHDRTDYSFAADVTVYVTDFSFSADKIVFLTDDRRYVSDISCLTGDSP